MATVPKAERTELVQEAICEGVGALASVARSIAPGDAWSYLLLRLAAEKMLYELRANGPPEAVARIVEIAEREVGKIRDAADRILMQREEGASVVAEALAAGPEAVKPAASRKSDAPPAPAG